MIQSNINSMFSNIAGTAYQMKRDADIQKANELRADEKAKKEAERQAKAAQKEQLAKEKAAASLEAKTQAKKDIKRRIELLRKMRDFTNTSAYANRVEKAAELGKTKAQEAYERITPLKALSTKQAFTFEGGIE